MEDWQKVPCKLSTKGITPDGYSRISGEGAHRIAWRKVYGPIPSDKEICHHCSARNCIEPLHLFLGTHLENMQDASRKGTLNKPRKRARCWKGHELTPENTILESNGRRRCKICRKASRTTVEKGQN